MIGALEITFPTIVRVVEKIKPLVYNTVAIVVEPVAHLDCVSIALAVGIRIRVPV